MKIRSLYCEVNLSTYAAYIHITNPDRKTFKKKLYDEIFHEIYNLQLCGYVKV